MDEAIKKKANSQGLSFAKCGPFAAAIGIFLTSPKTSAKIAVPCIIGLVMSWFAFWVGRNDAIRQLTGKNSPGRTSVEGGVLGLLVGLLFCYWASGPIQTAAFDGYLFIYLIVQAAMGIVSGIAGAKWINSSNASLKKQITSNSTLANQEPVLLQHSKDNISLAAEQLEPARRREPPPELAGHLHKP